MHVPQSLQAKMELKHITAVPKQIISPSSSSAIIAPAQDNLLGLYKITDDKVLFAKMDFMNIISGISIQMDKLPEPKVDEDLGNGKRYQRWSGKQIVSLILPPINIVNDDLVIVNGVLEKGQIDKGAAKKIVHNIFKDYGYKETEKYLNNSQKIVSQYLIRSGFSIGMSDLIISQGIMEKHNQEILNSRKEATELTRKVHLNIFENVSKGVAEIYDIKINGLLGTLTSKIQKETSKEIDEQNRVKYMIDSGSKGSPINLMQMTCLLGQQIADGKRIQLNFNNRTLPYYNKYDNGIESRGFVSNNFKDGLTPQEFFFHAITGRNGLIDTAVKTAQSGYIERKLIKALEDIKVLHDGSVRRANGDVVQFAFGGDCFNSIYLEKMNISILLLNKLDDLEDKILLDPKFKWSNYINTETMKQMNSNKKFKTILNEYNDYIQNDLITNIHEYLVPLIPNAKKMSDKINSEYLRKSLTIYFPVNFGRLISHAKNTYNLTGKNKCDISPDYIINKYKELYKGCTIMGTRNFVLEVLLNDKLSPKFLITKLRITKVAFDNIVNTIKIQYLKSLAQGGEMCGLVSAQSIGEISTQLTLNTFHFAGVGEKSSVNKGVPRLLELLDNRANLKEPQLNIYLDEKYKYDIDKVNQVKYNLELVKIIDLLESEAVYFKPNNEIIPEGKTGRNVLDEDKDIMRIYDVFSELDDNYSKIPSNPWVIRLEFNHHEMIEKNITMDDIYVVLSRQVPDASIMYSDDNSGKLIFRLRLDFNTNENDVENDMNHIVNKMGEIEQIIIKGINGLTKVYNPMIDTRLIENDGNDYNFKKSYYFESNGGSLFDVIMKPYIDSNRTTSINQNEMYQLYGIEAARWTLEEQFTNVFEVSGSSTSPRNISLLCDFMTLKGVIMSIHRTGLNSAVNNTGPLAKCSFEETVDQLKRAGVFGDVDNVDGVSANIMLGQAPSCGTGESKIFLDEERLEELLKEMNIKEGETTIDAGLDTNIDDLFGGDEYCMKYQDIGFDINAIDGDDVDLLGVN